mmetsp:Transcript_61915/g.133155  ORF Transcript_61915/g.133155 Transcript_61915/m.133155 type:complete len:639 (-) Transcript_61915:88-2004(-)
MAAIEDYQLVRRRSPSRKRSPSPQPYETGIVVGGKATRGIEIWNEDGTESITIGAANGTKTTEVTDLLGSLCQVMPSDIKLVTRVGSYLRAQKVCDEIDSKVMAVGIKSFKPGGGQIQEQKINFKHPLYIIGGGLGGIQSAIYLMSKGRERHNVHLVEKLHDFGGASWMLVSNQFTKLQTERGTYHIDYIIPGKEVPKNFGDMPYKTWPSRDQLLTMFRHSAKEHGLYDQVNFNTSVEKVKVLNSFGEYALQTVPTDSDDAGEIHMASAVVAWPGNLCACREIDFPGEDSFGGYIEYSSYCKVDYTMTTGKNVILYGHGAFTIENVRTLVEHSCKKVMVMCRKRNLCGMKVVSWMASQSEIPIAGNVMLDAFQMIYDLVGFDVWSAHSVKTDSKRSFAHISQKTVFGVTDVYFLAGYYGLMEVVVDEIKRMTHHMAHTKKGKKLEAECLIKAVGTVPSFKIDKMLGLKEMHGFWVQGDPLRPVCCNGMHVEARNFGGFSSGPGFAGQVPLICWFIERPQDWENVRGKLPINRAGERPAYVPTATHFLPTMSLIPQVVPGVGAECGMMDAQKAIKQRQAHPLGEYIEECKAEWYGYIKFFKKAGMVDDRPEPPYPYTAENVQELIDKSDQQFMKKQGMM